MVSARSFAGNGRHCTSKNANLSASASQMSAITCSASPAECQNWHKEINWNQDENTLLVLDFPVFGVEGFRVFRSV